MAGGCSGKSLVGRWICYCALKCLRRCKGSRLNGGCEQAVFVFFSQMSADFVVDFGSKDANVGQKTLPE